MLLLIDNYDSFTYNLVHYFEILNCEIKVIRNDAITISEIKRLQPEYIVLSPGPKTPNEAGITLDIIKHFAGTIPLLGVCLGHQAIAQYYGAKIIRAPAIMHGKTSLIFHQQQSVFHSLPTPFNAMRYHSLIADYQTIPEELNIVAWTFDQNHLQQQPVVMAIQHCTLPIVGIQFHPESIATEHGVTILENFLKII